MHDPSRGTRDERPPRRAYRMRGSTSQNIIEGGLPSRSIVKDLCTRDYLEKGSSKVVFVRG